MNEHDLRTIKTEIALKDTFFELIQKKSFDKITINQLCEKAMIRRSTFYRHYNDKFDFLGKIIKDLLQSFNMKHMEKYNLMSPEVFYKEVIEDILLFLQEHDYISKAIFSSDYPHLMSQTFYNEIYDIIYQRFQQEKRNGFVFYMEEEILAEFFTGGILRVIFNWQAHPQHRSADELSEAINRMLVQFWQMIPNKNI